jgi:hypothetical protein
MMGFPSTSLTTPVTVVCASRKKGKKVIIRNNLIFVFILRRLK